MFMQIQIRQLVNRVRVRKLHRFTVMQPLKPGKDNTYTTSQYYNIQNLRRYLVSYHDINISLYCPALVTQLHLFRYNFVVKIDFKFCFHVQSDVFDIQLFGEEAEFYGVSFSSTKSMIDDLI